MTLKNVLEEICAKEYALPENAPYHRFSLKHRRAMNKILYPDNLPKTEKRISLKRRAVVVAAIVVLVVVTGAASIIRYKGFWFDRVNHGGQTYYHVFAENAGKAPKTIEKLCYECKVPEKYQRIDSMCRVSENDAQEMFVDANAVVPENHGKPIVRVLQITKNSFVNPIQPDQDEYTPIEVKGHNGFSDVITIDLDDGHKFILNSVMWDCGDYIHYVGGTVPMEEIMSIVEGMTEKP